MSDQSRILTGLPSRQPADPKKLLRRNRPEPQPAPVVDELESVSAETPAAEIREAPAAAQQATREKPVARTAAASKAKDGRINTYIDPAVRSRAVAAFQHTGHLEGETAWNEFVELALLELAQRREQEHNGGRQFTQAGALKAGRPLKA